MKQIFLLLALLASWNALAQKAPSCAGQLQAFTFWEDEIKGKIVEKETLFDLVEWDPNSQYDGILLTKTAAKTLKNPILEVEYRSKSGAKKKSETFKDLKPFERNPDLLQFDDFIPRDFFNLTEDGTYRVRLKTENRVICEQSFRFAVDH